MKQHKFYTEAAYGLGLFLLALATALSKAANLGMSMIAAPSYLLHLRIPGLSFGIADYLVQILALAVLLLTIRKVKFSYLLTFATALLYGFMLNGVTALVDLIDNSSLLSRILLYSSGIVICSASIALLFKSYIPPAAHELFVKGLCAHFSLPLGRVKIAYDCTLLGLSIVMSLLFFARLEGIGIGTVVCAFVNGPLIRFFSGLYDRIFDFQDRFPLRSRLED